MLRWAATCAMTASANHGDHVEPAPPNQNPPESIRRAPNLSSTVKPGVNQPDSVLVERYHASRERTQEKVRMWRRRNGGYGRPSPFGAIGAFGTLAAAISVMPNTLAW